mmetsp:Transcript_23800/g.66484  ORF Transcript_23800/g.66484 Transcript_23800/m.66484 type:complete len:223 (-) Transcript_23800:386-1054(-)
MYVLPKENAFRLRLRVVNVACIDAILNTVAHITCSPRIVQVPYSYAYYSVMVVHPSTSYATSICSTSCGEPLVPCQVESVSCPRSLYSMCVHGHFIAPVTTMFVKAHASSVLFLSISLNRRNRFALWTKHQSVGYRCLQTSAASTTNDDVRLAAADGSLRFDCSALHQFSTSFHGLDTDDGLGGHGARDRRPCGRCDRCCVSISMVVILLLLLGMVVVLLLL